MKDIQKIGRLVRRINYFWQGLSITERIAFVIEVYKIERRAYNRTVVRNWKRKQRLNKQKPNLT
jgi:hypothetical protein